jgi:hypothetical protein
MAERSALILGSWDVSLNSKEDDPASVGVAEPVPCSPSWATLRAFQHFNRQLPRSIGQRRLWSTSGCCLARGDSLGPTRSWESVPGVVLMRSRPNSTTLAAPSTSFFVWRREQGHSLDANVNFSAQDDTILRTASLAETKGSFWGIGPIVRNSVVMVRLRAHWSLRPSSFMFYRAQAAWRVRASSRCRCLRQRSHSAMRSTPRRARHRSRDAEIRR